MTASLTASKPSVIPELFTGDKSWDEWFDYFEIMADVCGWDEENKLKWMRVHLVEKQALCSGIFLMLQRQTTPGPRLPSRISLNLSLGELCIKQGCILA